MKCPYCGDQESKVVDSRHSDDGLSIRRRRECLSCQKRFTTYETVESLPIIVVKKDGSRQSFDRNKVLNGMVGLVRSGRFPWPPWNNPSRKSSKSCKNSLEREVKIGNHRGIGDGTPEAAGRSVLRTVCLRIPPIQGCPQLHG